MHVIIQQLEDAREDYKNLNIKLKALNKEVNNIYHIIELLPLPEENYLK